MLKSRTLLWSGTLAILLLLGLAWFIPRMKADVEGTDSVKGTDSNKQSQHNSSPKPRSTEIDHTPRLDVLLQGDSNRFSVPLHWVGEPVDHSVTVRLIGLNAHDIPVATGSLDAGGVECDIPADGVYRLDFAAAGIYAADHELHVISGAAHLARSPELVGGKIPVSRAATVEVLVEHDTTSASGDSLSLTWWCTHWPLTQKPHHDISVDVGTRRKILAPLGSIEFHTDSTLYYIKEPTPPIFNIIREDDTLKITISRLVPLIVRLIEGSLGQWRELLRERSGESAAESLVIVDAFATTADGKPVRTVSRSGSFLRSADNILPAGRATDTFTFGVPVPSLEVDIHTTIRLHGEGVIAAGSVTAGPHSREIQIDADMYGKESLLVRVVDENSNPLPGISVALDVQFVAQHASSMTSRAVGAQQRGTTSPEGEVSFESVPVGDRLFAQVIVMSDYPVITPSTRIKLDREDARELVITLKTSGGRSLRISVIEGNKPPTESTAIVVFEGDGKGSWFRMHSTEHSSTFNTPVESEYAFVVGRCGECIFSQSVWIEHDQTEIAFDLSAMIIVEGKVSISDAESATLYPYGMDAAVLWAATLAKTELPALPLGENGMFRVGVPESNDDGWVAVTSSGKVYNLTSSQNADDPNKVELQCEAVDESKVYFTLDQAKLDGATDVSILICPIYNDGPKSLSIELKLGVRIDVGTGGSASRTLPHGRYIAILTYIDKNGAIRFGMSSGQNAEFRSISGLKTRINLPIR